MRFYGIGKQGQIGHPRDNPFLELRSSKQLLRVFVASRKAKDAIHVNKNQAEVQRCQWRSDGRLYSEAKHVRTGKRLLVPIYDSNGR